MPCRSDVLLNLHLHKRLGEHPDALLEEVRIVLHLRLAQQPRQAYPQFIGHRVSVRLIGLFRRNHTVAVLVNGPFAFYTLTRTLSMACTHGASSGASLGRLAYAARQ